MKKINSDWLVMSDEDVTKQAKTELPHITVAFEELIKRHEKNVYAICLRYFGRVDLAEEVSQETFLKLFQNLASFKGNAKFSTWLYRITINACHSRAKKLTPRQVDTVDTYANDLALSIPFECHDEADCIQYCLDQQSEQAKAMISMRFNSELELKEIATILQLKLSATKMRLYRALENFKSLYEKVCL